MFALMNTNNIIHDLDPKVLRRYLEAREIIDEKADRILNISLILGLLKHCSDDTVQVDAQAFAFFADMINSDICDIVEALNDFIYVLDVTGILSELDRGKIH